VLSDKPIIHFAHANGFPARTYRKIFSCLEDEFEIGFLERHGHNPHFPVTDGWHFLKDELGAEIEKRWSAEKIIGVGHSLGGILHFLLAVERPELYRQLVLLDSPLMSRLSELAFRLMKRTGGWRKTQLIRQTDARRRFWRSKKEAFEHFKRKKKFAAFDEDVLRDYVEYGTVEKKDGVELFFDPQIESRIYQTLAHGFASFRGRLKVPTAYIGGTYSDEARAARLGFMRKNFPIDFYFIEGSHLFPFEKPCETAALIKQIVRREKI
jgi:pimeloyl-ACP methyl ester carboxylesterase